MPRAATIIAFSSQQHFRARPMWTHPAPCLVNHKFHFHAGRQPVLQLRNSLGERLLLSQSGHSIMVAVSLVTYATQPKVQPVRDAVARLRDVAAQQQEDARDIGKLHGAQLRVFTHGVEFVWLVQRRTEFAG